MNLKASLSTLCIIASAAFCAQAAQTYPVRLQAPPAGSPTTQTYDEATNTYTITVNDNTFGSDDVRPTIRFAEITEVLPPYARCLAFDYKSNNGCGQQKFFCYKMYKGSLTQKFTYTKSMPATDEWITYRIPVGEYRDSKARNYGNIVGQYQDLLFMDFVRDTKCQIRNIRYEDEELPFVDVTLTPNSTSFIEAENFNVSAVEGRNYTSRQRTFDKVKYISPTPGQFPIYAFTSIDYVQQNVSDDFMQNMKATADLMNKKYRDMEAAGFNITEGGAFSGIDKCFLYDGLENFNGYQANLHDGLTDLKMIIRAGTNDDNVIRGAMGSDRCAGYHVKDEPHVKDIPAAASLLRKIKAVDNSRLLYGNLLHMNTVPGDIGAKSYDDYATQYIEQTGIGVLSYDYYAVRTMGSIVELNPSEHPEIYTPTREYTFLMPNFFMNMEIISKLAKYYDMPWWGFTRAMSGLKRTNPSSVYCKGNFLYPSPTEDHMRVQAFSLLCYGAQGLQYWPYVNCDGCYDAPLNADGTVNPAYHYAKAINTEVKALTWVFLGAELVQVGHTNAVTPDGCVRLTKAIMPEGVSAVTTSGQGMPVSTLQNGNNLFMMAVNPDLWDAQDITVTLDHAAKLVNPDGTTTAVAAGTHTTNLLPGRYLIYLLDENATPIDNHKSPEPVYNNYRIDASDVAFTAHNAASNGFYLPNMGTHSWKNYSLPTPIEETRTITRDQAVQNWGATYSYSFEVAEDGLYDISIGHSVPWSEYGRVASVGVKPGNSYTIEGEPELNWPKQYAASMTLSLDGETVMPAHSIRPAVPAEFDEAGTEFNAILADKSRWISTVGDENLYFWPKAGGDDDVTPRYNAAPDYRGVKLTAGTHRFVVKSNCYPWNFDNIKIAPADLSGIDNLVDDNAAATLKATAIAAGILVETDADFTVYSLAGVAVAAGQGSQLVDLNAGLYIVVSNNTSIKVLVK